MRLKPYNTSPGKCSKYYIDGPGSGGHFSYYGGHLYPETRFDTEEEAEKACKLVNIAYNEGYRKAQLDIQLALGINS